MCKTHEKDVRTIRRCSCPECRREPDGAVAREHQAINRIIACTDERSRRLVAGFLARLYGHGGNHSAGAHHRLGSQHDRPRPTRVGPSGRPPAGPGAAPGGRSQARGGPIPGIVTALEELLADATAGDPRLRQEVDAPLAHQPPEGPQAPGVQGIPSDHRPADARPGLLVADLSQEQGGDPQQGPGSAVPLPGAAAEDVPGPGMAGNQRRYQEEGVGR